MPRRNMNPVLVVDDEISSREYLSRLLTKRGYTVVQANDGQEALRATREHRPCLVITDVLMPLVDGYEFVRQLRLDADVAATPVIFFTGAYGVQEAASLAESSGVLKIVTKPAPPGELLRIIEDAVRCGPTQAPAPVSPDDYERRHLRVVTNKLSDREQLLKAVFDNVIDSILLTDDLGQILDANRAAWELTGRTRQELRGLRIDELVSEAERGATRASWQSLSASGKVSGEQRILRPDGTTRDSEFLAIANILSGIHLMTSHDITERKEAERALRLRGEQLAEAQRIASVGSWSHDLRTGKVTWSDELFRIFGLSPETVTSYDAFMERVHGDDQAMVREVALSAVQTRIPFECDYRIVRTDGTIRHIHEAADVLTDTNGEVTRFLGTAQDVTARRHAEEQLRDLSGRLFTTQDEERRSIAKELHDSTAQDLAAVAMNLSALQTLLGSENAKIEALVSDSQAIIEQCNREIRTLSALLHPPLLDELGLEGALRHYANRFGARSGIQITVTIAGDAGRMPGNVETALFRVVQEGLGNIHRHSGSSSATILIRRSEDQCALEISDQGHGMPPEIAELLPQAGAMMGIGITSMRERIRQLGGNIALVSSPAGTTVRAVVPLPARSTENG